MLRNFLGLVCFLTLLGNLGFAQTTTSEVSRKYAEYYDFNMDEFFPHLVEILVKGNVPKPRAEDISEQTSGYIAYRMATSTDIAFDKYKVCLPEMVTTNYTPQCDAIVKRIGSELYKNNKAEAYLNEVDKIQASSKGKNLENGLDKSEIINALAPQIDRESYSFVYYRSRLEKVINPKSAGQKSLLTYMAFRISNDQDSSFMGKLGACSKIDFKSEECKQHQKYIQTIAHDYKPAFGIK